MCTPKSVGNTPVSTPTTETAKSIFGVSGAVREGDRCETQAVSISYDNQIPSSQPFVHPKFCAVCNCVVGVFT